MNRMMMLAIDRSSSNDGKPHTALLNNTQCFMQVKKEMGGS